MGPTRDSDPMNRMRTLDWDHPDDWMISQMERGNDENFNLTVMTL
jgi:hypothetical protein